MIAEDEWLVVIDRQRVFAESEWSAWACPDGSYHTTDEAFARLAKAFGDRVVYTRYVAPESPQNAWVDYFKDWPQFLVLPTIRCTISPRIPRNWRKAMPWSVATLSASGEAC